MEQDTHMYNTTTLPQDLSHILIHVPAAGLAFDPREYLTQRGVRIEGEAVSSDSRGRDWLILSIRSPDISRLVLELIEKGLSGNIQGINAKTPDTT